MVVDINSEDTYEKSEREIVNMGEQTSIDYITNYFVSTDENAISKEALCWLTNAHLPHKLDEEEWRIVVFNINKSYIKEFVSEFCLQNWYYKPINEFGCYDEGVAAMLKDVNQRIAENVAIYRTYTRKPDEGAFVLNDNYIEIANKAFKGTGYRNWKARYYLTRGLLSEEYSAVLAENAINVHKNILKEAAETTGTDISTFNVHIYYDWYTFYTGWFQSDYEALTTIGGYHELATLNDEMTRLIKANGFERNISTRCGIQGYRSMLGLEMPREFVPSTPCNDGGDIHSYTIVPYRNREELVEYLNEDYYKAFGIDYSGKSLILINLEYINDLIDKSDYMYHGTIIGDDHDFFWRNVQAQIGHNKAIGKAPLSNIKGIDYWDERYREPKSESPKEYIAAASNFNDLMESIAHVILGDDYDEIRPTIYLKMETHRHHRTHIIDTIIITFRFANGEELNREVRRLIMGWLLEKGFMPFPEDEYVLKIEHLEPFINYLFEACPDSHEYFKVKDRYKRI